jgi:hypothetical protein
MEKNADFVKRYHPAVLLLLWKDPQKRLTLNRTEGPYSAFYGVVKPLLRRIDYEVQPAEKRRGRPETRWHLGLRASLLNMREDKHPEDGRVRYLGGGTYELTDRGLESLKSYLWSPDLPLEWLELEIEDLDENSQLFHYRHPITGEEMMSFGTNLHYDYASLEEEKE